MNRSRPALLLVATPLVGTLAIGRPVIAAYALAGALVGALIGASVYARAHLRAPYRAAGPPRDISRGASKTPAVFAAVVVALVAVAVLLIVFVVSGSREVGRGPAKPLGIPVAYEARATFDTGRSEWAVR